MAATHKHDIAGSTATTQDTVTTGGNELQLKEVMLSASVAGSTVDSVAEEGKDDFDNDEGIDIITKQGTLGASFAGEENANNWYDLIDEPIPLPYKRNKCWSKFEYYLKTMIVVNPRTYSLYLLYSSVWPRALTMVDVFTDINIAIQLYIASYEANASIEQRKQAIMLFMLSCMFISFPFIMVWAVSLRFIQKMIHNYNNRYVICFTKN